MDRNENGLNGDEAAGRELPLGKRKKRQNEPKLIRNFISRRVLQIVTGYKQSQQSQIAARTRTRQKKRKSNPSSRVRTP